jgi:hypothetical protein
MNALLPVGFWWSEDEPLLPHPRDFVDESWDEDERRRVIAYLESAYLMPYVSCGPSWCRLGCPGIPADIGCQELTDGTWLFPEGLAHYVRHHGVKPPEAFLDHLRGSGFTMPDLPAIVPGSGETPKMCFDLGPIHKYIYVITIRIPLFQLASALGIGIDEEVTLDEHEALDRFGRELDAALGRSVIEGKVAPPGDDAPIADGVAWECPAARLAEIEESRLFDIWTSTSEPHEVFERLEPILSRLGLLPMTTVAFRRSGLTYQEIASADHEVIWPPGGFFDPDAE